MRKRITELQKLGPSLEKNGKVQDHEFNQFYTYKSAGSDTSLPSHSAKTLGEMVRRNSDTGTDSVVSGICWNSIVF